MPYRKTYSRADSNQKEIVKALKKIPGIAVELAHDDVLVGYKGRNYWYEIKTSEKARRRPKQEELDKFWPGHYKFVWSVEMILEDLGITHNS